MVRYKAGLLCTTENDRLTFVSPTFDERRVRLISKANYNANPPSFEGSESIDRMGHLEIIRQISCFEAILPRIYIILECTVSQRKPANIPVPVS